LGKIEKNAIPLWIKIHKDLDKPIILLVSQRYRKVRDVIIRRPDNLIFPFEISEDSLLDFNEVAERLESIRILFFNQKVNNQLLKSIGPQMVYSEVIEICTNHFENYSFYPPSYNYTPKGEGKYNSMVIKKDIATNQFSVYKNPSLKEEIKSHLNLEEAVAFYINKELKHEILGIKIEHLAS
jgi:hypothetical protein